MNEAATEGRLTELVLQVRQDCWRSPKTDHLCSVKVDQGWAPAGVPPHGDFTPGGQRSRAVAGSGLESCGQSSQREPHTIPHLRSECIPA